MKAWPPFIGLCLLSTGCVVGRNHTSDADLQRNFLRHEAEFETLLRDVTADEKLQMLRPYALRYAGATVWNPGSISEVERVGLSRERWEKYQRQLRELGLAQVTKGGGEALVRPSRTTLVDQSLNRYISIFKMMRLLLAGKLSTILIACLS